MKLRNLAAFREEIVQLEIIESAPDLVQIER